MSFQIHPVREILVVPALPPALSRLPELGLNLLWSWNHTVRAVFRRLDPAVWKATNHNPVVMLGRVEQAALERAAADPRFLALYRRACEILDSYLSAHAPIPTCWWRIFRWSTACWIACPFIPAAWGFSRAII